MHSTPRFLAQVAGKIQGLVDGDLGDLGSASLSERQLLYLLDLCINDVVKVFDKAGAAVTVGRKRLQKMSNQTLWCPVDNRQQLMLEVVAKLLACAQRLYMSREGWNALENPDERLEALLKVPSANKDDEWSDPDLPEMEEEPPARILAKCPWMHLVLRKLMPPKHGARCSDPTSADKIKDQFGSACIENPLRPVLKLIANDNDTHESPIPYLAIIGASAEFFPGGECWALSAIENWRCFIPEDKLRGEVIWYHGSSTFDLISLLSILSNLLEEHGQPESVPSIQYWILLILTKLTETTAVLVQNLKNMKNRRSYLLSLTIEWRMIWKILLRSDLRYTSYASFLGENSLGEIFVILLTEIISRKCTEVLETTSNESEYRQSSFIYEQQEHIWSFMLRKPTIFRKVGSRAQFDLISSISKFAGLSDAKFVEESERPLRHELFSLALRSFKEVLMKSTQSTLRHSSKHEFVRSIASCIVCLVNGNCPSMPWLSSTDSRFSIARRDDKDLSIEENRRLIHVMQQENSDGIYFKLLWDNTETFEEESDLSCFNLHTLDFDSTRLVAKRLRDRLKNEDRCLEKHTLDFISESDSEKLRGKVFTFVREEMLYHSKEAELSVDLDDSATVRKESQTGAVKLVLSLMIAQKRLDSDLLTRSPDIVSFFTTSVSDLAGGHFEPDEYLEIANDLRQMSQTFIEIISRHPSTVDLSQQMMISIADCQSILKRYLCQVNNKDSSSASNEVAMRTNGESEDDDSDFGSVEMARSPQNNSDKRSIDNYGKNKRRMSGGYGYNTNSGKRRKTQSNVLAPPNFKCAAAIGSLLLAMDPSFSNCRLVCEALLGTDIDVDPKSVQGDMNLSPIINSVNFLGKSEVLLNNLAKQKMLGTGGSDELTPVMMLCQAIDLVRECAEPSSRFFMYGNYACAKTAVETLKLGLTLTSEEAKLIIDVLSVDDGMRGRPSLTAERVQAATYVFENGSDEFHHLFDKFFANTIVKAGFDDPNFYLRRLASVAAGAASCKLDEQRILNSVSNRIAPIFSASTAQNTVDLFKDWYVRSGLSSTEEEDLSTIEATDSLEAMESDSIFAKVLLAGSTHNRKSFNKLLHEILEIPVVRPGLEFMCYRALEKLASMRGYSDVQELVDLEAEGLLAVWLQKLKDTNTTTYSRIFPLSFTSPKSVRYVMLYGRYDYLIQSQFSPEPNDESIYFQNKSAINFVRRYRGFIIPFTLLKSHDVMSKYKSSNLIIEHLSNDFGFKVVLAMVDSSGDDNSNAIIKILQHHIVDIQTMYILLMHSGDNLKKNVGQSIHESLTKVVSEKSIESRTKGKKNLLIQRVIQLVGQARRLSEVMPISESACYEAIKHLTNASSQSKHPQGDIFIRVGTSLTEVTIDAYEKLMKSKLSTHQLDAWSRFAILGEFLADQFGNCGYQIQFDFFLHVLNEILLKNSLHKSIRSRALSLIQKVLRESLCLNQTELDKEVVPVINKLIGVCFHVHEESQRNLLQDWRQKLIKHKFDLRRSCGVNLRTVTRWDMQSDHSDKALDLKQSITTSTSAELDHDCLVGTYDILLWIVENRESLRLDSCVFANLSIPYEVESSDLDILGKVDKRYSAQMLRQGLRDRKSNRTLHQYILGLKHWTQRSHFLYTPTQSVDHHFSRISCKHATIDERLMCAELVQTEVFLKETKMNKVSNSDLNCLLSYFCCICKTSSSQKVRFALSRCIALLEPSTLVNFSGMKNTNATSSESNYDSLLLELRAKCIDCLAELLKSPNTKVAMAAVTTLEAILSNDEAKTSCSMVATTTVSLIKPFVCEEQSSRVDATILSDGEVRLLVKSLGLRDDVGTEDDGHSCGAKMWCWDKKVWTFGNSTAPQFEVWIRHLTSAIIVCCFDSEEEKDSDGILTNSAKSSFFWHCQRIAYLDHVFASTIFPLLILALLQREEQNFCDEENFDGFKGLIANSFESVLLSWIRPDNSIGIAVKNNLKFKSLSIVVDTLDVLRKVSQGRFLSFEHKANKRTKKRRSKGGYNVGLDPLIPWQGISYGVILNVDGIIVAEACMEVQRFASALFFLEMYFNSQYGKSGGLFEELDNTVSCVDVIGEVNYFSKINDSTDDDLKVRTIKAMSMTGRCYKELGEIELMHATNMQMSSLNFTDDSDHITVDLDKLRGISPLDTLQMLGFRSSQMSDSDDRLFSSLTDSMEALGLEGLINTYIEGVFVQNKDLKEMVDVQIMREKWFENNLETQNWSMMFREQSKTRRDRSSTVTSSGKLANRGYFELLSESLNSLSNSDTNSSKLLLHQAHSSVVDSLSNIAGEQLSPEKFVKVVDRLRALQDVNKLLDAEVDLSTFPFDQMWTLDVSLRIRQITLTALASKYPEKSEVIGALKDHLWKTCDCAVDRGRPQIAESALSKLRYLLRVPIGIKSLRVEKSDEILRIRLEEAKIMECRGDFNGAIQRSKQLIRHIGDKNSNLLQKCLLCDAQILCGSWMTKYKTQQARVILESYLNPASARAKSIFEDENTKVNAERATRAFIKLGHILANLHDDLLLRIHGKEWEETETRLQHQHQQCLNSEDHRRELQQELKKLSNSNPRKEEVCKHWKATEHHFSRLEKEYERTNKERNGIKRLVPYYLNNALKAFLSALEMAGTSSDDLSSHIFRMVSLWFSYQNDTANDAVTNDVMQEGLCKLPSFRFVTLTNQLFSRIESCEGRNDEKFQGTLQHLVFRMCNDHPYHCMAPLIALTNGKVDSKIRGVQQIIDKIDKSGTQYVRDLLDSYIILVSAYNDLAHVSTKKYQGSRKKIKFAELFPTATKKSLDQCLNRFPGVPSIVTCPPVVRPGKDYGGGKEDPIGGERITGFESDFAITESGIHRPKIVMCIGSQGGSFRQLVKGEDDIRQDAIMSQVFTYVNNLMKRRTNTTSVSSEDPSILKTVAGQSRHRLNMATYNVLPLSPSSGVSQNISFLSYEISIYTTSYTDVAHFL